jgi:prepilin-type N-terminal cleavage/methylation domain-containing protein
MFRKQICTGGRGFTIVELLVVISIIAILAGLLLPVVMRGRGEARTANCISNLHQVGIALNVYAQHYGEGKPDGYPPWITMLTKRLGSRTYLDEPRVLLCPSDGNSGAQGGRPDNMRDTGGDIIYQFPMADVDEHSGARNGVGPTNSQNGGKDCSYLFEFCGEPCDWIYGDPPIGPGDSSTVPKAPGSPEWMWETEPGYGVPTWATFKKWVDRDGNGVLSWNEVKVFSRTGCERKIGEDKYKLPAWHIRVPVLRCYWHVEGMSVLNDESFVLNLRSDGSADRGVLKWYE